MNFEQHFTEKQKGMISLALEYADAIGESVDKVYIYTSFENNLYAFDIFFKKNDEYYMLHELSNSVDPSLIIDVLQIGNKDLRDIKQICDKYAQQMPTQMKIIYDNNLKKVSAEYSYDIFHSDSTTLTYRDIFQKWFKEVKNSSL